MSPSDVGVLMDFSSMPLPSSRTDRVKFFDSRLSDTLCRSLRFFAGVICPIPQHVPLGKARLDHYICPNEEICVSGDLIRIPQFIFK
jgi:hypothetical protein